MTIQDGETDGNGLNGWMLSEKKARRMDKSWGAGLLSCRGYLDLFSGHSKVTVILWLFNDYLVDIEWVFTGYSMFI